jgi:hypothetical protein
MQTDRSGQTLLEASANQERDRSRGRVAEKAARQRLQRSRRAEALATAWLSRRSESARADVETRRVGPFGLARTLEGNQAHGRRGLRRTGNGASELRTRQRSKASRSRVGVVLRSDTGLTARGQRLTAT